MYVQLPNTSTLRTIKIEMAPLNMMPHAVHTFLEQVDQKHWDGTQFDVHAGHVLLARPDPASDDSNGVLKDIKEVPTVMFPEYHKQYPHDKYTVAFPGRPGTGQDFYINLQSNTVYHSPRVEKDSDNNERYLEGEPCFGKIVDESSQRVVDDMDSLAVGKGGIMTNPVIIREARIVAARVNVTLMQV